MNILRLLFDKKILKYTVLPFVIDLVFWFIVFFIFHDSIISILEAILTNLPLGDKVEEVISSFGSWILIVIFYYIAVISTLGIFSSFFVDKIVLRVNEFFNCNVRKVGFKDSLKGLFISIKSFLIYALIFMFTFYLLFNSILSFR